MANYEYTKKLVVKNLSDVPLMYRIEKTKNWVAQAFMNFGALQRVAVCCSVLQCVAVCCSVLQCVAMCCSALQCVAPI